MTDFFRKAYSVVSVLLLVEILAQFYFIAAAAFSIWLAEDNQKSIAAAFKNAGPFAGLHAMNGSILVPATILVLIGLSFAARYSWRTTGLTALLAAAFILQFALAIAGFAGITPVAGLHAVNALVILGLAAWTVRRNWAFGERGARAQAAVAEPVRS